MLMTELRPAVVAVFVVMERCKGRFSRLMRVRVLFPDLGVQPVLDSVGFLRYQGESSFLRYEATVEELLLLAGLTSHL